MNNIFVYIELENGAVADVSLELLTKGRELADELGVKLEAVVLGHGVAGIEKELAKYGGAVRPDPAGEAADRPVRCDARGPRFRAARVVGAAQRSDSRLHAARDRRPHRSQDQDRL